MSSSVAPYRFSVDEFVRAWEAGVFGHRVELIDGEVWPVVIGDRHGRTVGNVIFELRKTTRDVTTSTLPSGSSLPDPDCWVLAPGAAPLSSIGSRLSVWAPADVLLVVEVSDETLMADLTVKARIYGAAEWPVYWVVSPEEVYVHTKPSEAGYLHRATYRRGMKVPVPYADAEIAVDDLLA